LQHHPDVLGFNRCNQEFNSPFKLDPSMCFDFVLKIVKKLVVNNLFDLFHSTKLVHD